MTVKMKRTKISQILNGRRVRNHLMMTSHQMIMQKRVMKPCRVIEEMVVLGEVKEENIEKEK